MHRFPVVAGAAALSFFTFSASAQETVPFACPAEGTQLTYASSNGKNFTWIFGKPHDDMCPFALREQDVEGVKRGARFYMFCVEALDEDCKSHTNLMKLWPLKTGNSVRYYFPAPPSAGNESDFRADYTVEGVEDVTTSAGTFKTFRVNEKITKSRGRFERDVTYWYSPEVKFVIKSQNHLGGRDGKLVSENSLQAISLPK